MQKVIHLNSNTNNALKLLAALESYKRNKKVYVSTLIDEAIHLYVDKLWLSADYKLSMLMNPVQEEE